ncbi:MAG TPA: hypothetical protein VLF66_18160, partial [Thermoanaerobaculia bacterium]|nr:hypothetical protein [Thermoanaerobaculia bacterium]
MARSLLQPLNRLHRRRPPLEDGPAELVLAFSAGTNGAFRVHARSQADEDGVEGDFLAPAGGF